MNSIYVCFSSDSWFMRKPQDSKVEQSASFVGWAVVCGSDGSFRFTVSFHGGSNYNWRHWHWLPSWFRSEIQSTFQMYNWSCNINKFLIYLRGPPEFYHSPGFICSLDIANLKDCYIYKDILLCQIMYYRPIFVLVTTRFEAQLHIEVYIIPFLNSHESCLLRVRSLLEDKRAASRWNLSVSGIGMDWAGLGTNSVLTTLLLVYFLLPSFPMDLCMGHLFKHAGKREI